MKRKTKKPVWRGRRNDGRMRGNSVVFKWSGRRNNGRTRGMSVVLSTNLPLKNTSRKRKKVGRRESCRENWRFV